MINADRNYKRVYEKDFGKRCKRLLAYIYAALDGAIADETRS